MEKERTTRRSASGSLDVPMRWVAAAVVGASLVGSGYALAQGTRDPVILERANAVRITTLEQRMTSLQQRVTSLEQQNQDLRRFVAISGNSITITSMDSLKLSGGKNLDLSSAAVTTVHGGAAVSLSAPSLSLKADADVSVYGAVAKLSAQGPLELWGSKVSVNGGAKPVAVVGGGTSPNVLVP